MLFQTALAGSKNLEGVTRRFEMELVTNATLHLLKFRREEFNGIAARGADHMVVGSTIEAVFVSHYPVLKIHFERQATLSEQLQRSIDGRIPNGRILLFDKPMQVLCAQVIPGVQKHFKNPVPLCTLL